jgi:hypothetical protein
MKLVRIGTRMGAILVAASLFIALTTIWARSIRPKPLDGRPRLERRRPAAPAIGKFSNFLGHGILFALISLGGRKVLRLRLTDKPGA